MPGATEERPSAEVLPARRCTCVIAHAQNDAERAQVQTALDTALKIGDAHGVLIACLQLMQPCPARDGQATP